MKYLLSILILFFALFSFAQPNLDWAAGFGGSEEDRGLSITTDNAGNVYSTGFFQGTVDFDPGAGIGNLTALGLSDMYIQKLDPNGEFVWAKSVGFMGLEQGTSITTDDSGNVYITGYFTSGTLDFDPGPGVSNLFSFGNGDIFVLKLDSDGNFLWAKSMGGADADFGYSISIDPLGNVYSTGIFRETVDFDPGPGVASLSSAANNSFDIYTQKLDEDGNFVWVKRFGAALNDRSYAIITDEWGNTYITGEFWGTVDFDPGAGVANITSMGQQDIFILKLNTNGDFIWAKGMGSANYDAGYSITLDGLGNLLVAGVFTNNVDFDPGVGVANLVSAGLEDAFIQKLDTAGDFIWAKSMGGAASVELVNSISIDNFGNVYTTGEFNGIADFDPGSGVANLTAAGDDDIFIQKLDHNGDFLWANRIGGSGLDNGNSIAIDGLGNIYTSGSFEGTVNFDFGSSTSNFVSNGDEDIYIQKLNQCPTNWGTSLNGATITAGYSNASYVWLDCDDNFNIIQGETNQSFTASVNGNYAVQLTAFGCLDTSECVVISSVGIRENTLDNEFKLYPNPSRGKFSIEFSEPQEEIELKVLDVLGRIIDKQLYRGEAIIEYKLMHSQGVYFIELSDKYSKKSIVRLINH